jgi:hypothetical protein
MGMTANKLPTALRDALLGGYYDEGSLRLDFEIGTSTVTVPLTGISEISESEEVLFGWHSGEESDDWQVPALALTVENSDGRYTPGFVAGVIPVDISDYIVVETRWERITTSSWVKFYEQTWLLSEVQLRASSALLVCKHPLGGVLQTQFSVDQKHDIDWNVWDPGFHDIIL